MRQLPIICLALSTMLVACTSGVKTRTALLTAESGEKCQAVSNITFRKATFAQDEAGLVVVNPNDQRQILDGYGASLTESSAFVLACLSDDDRKAILHELFSEDGANFPIVRTQIGASDFSVEGNYSLIHEDDFDLSTFSLDEDKAGFSAEKYPQIRNEHYDLYHLMKEVAAIKAGQKDSEYRILANTWTAPAQFKDNGRYYERGMRDGQWVARGGKLLPQYKQIYADYLVKYLQAWREEGIEIWAMTPLNEPQGNDGGWESMELNGPEEAEFIAEYMGPALAKAGFGDVRIYGFDQNIFEAGPYTAAIYGNPTAADYTTGMAMHWYGSTFSCFPETLDSLHALYPNKTMLHTEGCIDNLGRPGWDAVTDMEGFQESGWFANDSFWWNNCATDWAYSTPYWPELHPAYSACQRYAQYIIEGMNHWLTGHIDWNIVLDSLGGPNHVLNNCGAPVMVDYDHNYIYYTPYYYILKQFSRLMRPGDVALGVTPTGNDSLYVSAARKQDGSIVVNVLNLSKQAISFPLQVGELSARITSPANSVLSFLL